MVLAYLGGILSSFTPCIYPMIPITMGFIGGAAERSWKSGWLLSSFYVLGMACVYAVLGVLASITGRIFGTMTNSPHWYLALGLVMVLSALWMFDVIEFDPNAWMQRFRKHKPHHGGHHHTQEESIFSAFILGASSGFIAAPCTTPVLTTILGFIATQHSIGLGTALMFSFALGLGTILVAVGTFTGALKVLPKSGAWLKAVKNASGYLILGLGLFYVFKAGKLS
jgi:thiol:disulfide interchange protein DsbD